MFRVSLETDWGLLSQLVKFYQNFDINPQMVSPNRPWSIYCLSVNTSNNKEPVISKSNESIQQEKVKPLRHKLLLNLQVNENRSLKWLHLEVSLFPLAQRQRERPEPGSKRQIQKQRHEKEKKKKQTIERKKRNRGRKGMIGSWHLAEGCFTEAAGVSTKLKSTSSILQPYK